MNVVITGAAGGVGAACIEAFQAQGAHVIGADVEESSAADEHITLDLSTPQCGAKLAEHVAGRPLDVLVNNAAFAGYSTALETTADAWDYILAVNLRGPFLVAKALYSNLVAAAGSVVNVGSVHAVATSPAIAAYAASKGGLLAFTRALALEWAPKVRVNCVLPGAVDTPMLIHGLSRSGGAIEDLAQRTPLGRVGSPADIAEAVLYLAQARYATGSSLVVDGGATARLSTE